MAWRVTATGLTTGEPYTYIVDAPQDADTMWVCISAGNEHSRKRGEPDYEHTGPMRAEWIKGER